MVNLLRIRPWVGLAPAQERDLKAEFEQILDLHYRRVYRLIYRMVRNEADAADLTQETFIRVYRALPRLRLDGACAAWIRRIATTSRVVTADAEMLQACCVQHTDSPRQPDQALLCRIFALEHGLPGPVSAANLLQHTPVVRERYHAPGVHGHVDRGHPIPDDHPYIGKHAS